MWNEGLWARHLFDVVQYSVNLSGDGGAEFNTATLVKALSCLRLLEELGVPVTIQIISASLSLCIKLLELRDVTTGIEKHFYLDKQRRQRVPRDELGHAERVVLTHVADMLYQTDGSNVCERWSRLMGREHIAWMSVEAMTILDTASSTTAALSSLAGYGAVSRYLGISDDVLERLEKEAVGAASMGLAESLQRYAWDLLVKPQIRRNIMAR